MSTAQKLAFAQIMQNYASALAQVRWNLHIANKLYMARGWQPGGSDPITNGEIAECNITATQLYEFVETVEDRLDKLMSNQSVTPFDGDGRVNTVRNDM